jgi:hypothetical protein
MGQNKFPLINVRYTCDQCDNTGEVWVGVDPKGLQPINSLADAFPPGWSKPMGGQRLCPRCAKGPPTLATVG